MSEIRQDITTKEWVILAPERGKRPQQGPKRRTNVTSDIPAWDADCPFCPGNESKTPKEIFRIPATNEAPDWQVRVVPNRFAALTPRGNTVRPDDGPFSRKMGGFGRHEVIIDSPSHNTPLALMPYEHIEKILATYQSRYNTIKQDRKIKHITIFKNCGWAAGTSLAHPHSQLVGTPIMATYYHRKFDVAHDYYADMGSCLYCDLINWNLEKGYIRVIAETKEFVVIHPFASHVPYETWIIPKMHYASFGLFPDTCFTELARVLKDIVFCLYKGLNSPAYNLAIDSTTTYDEEDPYYHWHIRIIPRMTTIAGFEMGSGIYINTSLPEDTAKYMREIAQSYPDDISTEFKK
jgi:UDPglucose--hexose-1-phosphate uridylyltransferase